jgi:vancomycin aglycone glucosyltransferase
MRVLLSTYGSRGDVEPLAGAALALQALGASAVVCAPGDQEFVDLLARAGVAFAPACMPIRQWIDEARRARLDLPALAAKLIPLQYDAIRAAAADCDAIVATGLFPSTAAAQCVAEKLGLAYVQVAFCPLSLPSHHHRPFPRPGYPLPEEVTDNRALWALNAQHMQELFGPAANAQRAAVGLGTIDNIRDHVFTDHPLLASDPVLWPWQATDLCEPVLTGAWIMRDERALPPGLTAFLEAGPPPVYAGFGSIAMQHAQELARTAIQAIRTQGRRVVLARGWAEMELIDQGDDCFLVGEVNQQALFGRCAAVLHHGGAGTTTTAARAGAPQVIAPQIVDQPYWAAHAARLGIGVALDAAPTVASMSDALKTALSADMRACAQALSSAIRTDGAAVAAKLIVQRANDRA